MKKLVLPVLLLLFTSYVSAQYQRIRTGLFKKWYIGTFTEARGYYSIALDTVPDNTLKHKRKVSSITLPDEIFLFTTTFLKLFPK